MLQPGCQHETLPQQYCYRGLGAHSACLDFAEEAHSTIQHATSAAALQDHGPDLLARDELDVGLRLITGVR